MHKTLLLILAFSCSKPPITAMSVCQKITESGVSSDCVDTKPGGLAANARRGAEFNLPSVPDKKGMVWLFDSKEHYEAAVADFDKHKILAGPHRYGNPSKMIFVQINSGLSMDDGDKVRAIVDSL